MCCSNAIAVVSFLQINIAQKHKIGTTVIHFLNRIKIVISVYRSTFREKNAIKFKKPLEQTNKQAYHSVYHIVRQPKRYSFWTVKRFTLHILFSVISMTLQLLKKVNYVLRPLNCGRCTYASVCSTVQRNFNSTVQRKLKCLWNI